MQSVPDPAWSPLHEAALRGDADLALRALAEGVAPTAALASAVLSRALMASTLLRPKASTIYPAVVARVEGPLDLAFDAGATALSVAAWAGQRGIVELLLARGAKVDARDDVGAAAMHHAARGGRDEIVAVLLAAKAKPDLATKKTKSVAFYDAGSTALHAALDHGHVAIARTLAAAGADARATTANGNTALFFAARGGDPSALDFLRDAGVSLVVAKPAYLDDPLHEATTRGHLALVRALIEAGNPAREALLREATAKGHDALRAYLLGAGAPPIAYLSPAAAARANDPWALAAMREQGLDVEGPDVLTSAIAAANVRVVDQLLAHGARLATASGVIGPLHMAIEHGHADIALALIERGAPIDAREPQGNTPLFVACARRGMERVLEALVARGANPHEPMRHGNSAWKVTDTIPTYRAILEKTTHVPDPSARGWEPPTTSRVLTDPSLRTSFRQTYQALFEELVPPRDAAPSIQGELVRVSHKLWDEAMRNGNGNFDQRHRAMAKVLDVICGPPFEGPRLKQIRDAVHAVAKGTLDDDMHRRVAHAVVEWCVANPELRARP